MGDTAESGAVAELGSIGLTETELAVYDALIERTAATGDELGRIPGVQPGQLDRALDGLESRGLVSRVPGKTGRYAAVAPELGLELLILQREEELKKARLAAAGLTDRFRRARAGRDPVELIEVITGAGAVSRHHSQVHRSARHELRIMSRSPFVQTDDENRAEAAELHRRGLRVRNIVDLAELDFHLSYIREDQAHGEQYRSMPDVPLKLIIADDSTAIIPLEIRGQGIQSAVLVHSSALLEALIGVFDTLWRLAYPLDALHGQVGPDGSGEEVNGPERDLLALLAGGAPDAAIARRLGISPSTVQRRVRALMTRLGAATRFQAGLQASLLGWITRPPDPVGTPE